MTITIWIVKGLLAALFAFSGLNKLFLPKPKLLEKGMKGLIQLEEKPIKVIGLLEVLGAIGLILPGLLHFFPVLSGVAALCLGLTMIVAARTHHRLQLSIIPNLVILAMCLFLAYWTFFGAI
ncbi:MAG: DoxX family protein [Saprospiraceae bacterium]|nr:DoxX family protein [Saprospiraceae bacterium]